MLNKIIHFALHNRLTVLGAALIIVVAGIIVTLRMEVDVFPDLNAPTVVVMTEAPGMAAEEVERLVTFPVETALNGATDVRRVRSSSTTGFSVVWVEFDWGTDVYRDRQIVSEKLATVEGQLPAGVGQPVLGPQSSILGEVMIIGLTADTTSQEELRTLADWTVRTRLLATGGVSQVAVLGGDVKEYQIRLHPDRMRQYGVSLGEVQAAVTDMNRNAAGGVLYEYGNEYVIRGEMTTNRADELGRAFVKRDSLGNSILLEHVATVTTGAKAPRLGTASYNGKPAVLVTVTKQPAVGTIQLTHKLEEALADLKTQLPGDVKISTDIFRQSNFIESAIGNVEKSLYEGGLFVVIVLVVFLMNGRTTVISLLTIPVSVLVALLALRLMGQTVNTMSLGGLAIAVGSLVDDAIVDVENVYKRLRANAALPESQRRKVMDVVYDASREVRMPILNSTLIIVASFLPLFFLSGMEGRMLAPLGLTFIVALFASTLVALTLTPALCSILLRNTGKHRADSHREPWVVRKLKAGYSHALEAALRHRRLWLTGTGIAFIAALLLLLTFGRSFLPPFNEGSLTINVSTLPGISLEESDSLGRRAERLLLSVPEIQAVGRKTGRAELDEHALGVNTSEMECPYELKDRSKEEMVAEVREKLGQLPGVNVEIGSPISHRIDAMLSGTQANIAIKVFGTDLNRLYALGNQIKHAVGNIEGVADLNVEQQVERPQLQIKPRRELLAQYGISLPEFSTAVSTLLGGEAVSQVYEGNRTFDLTLKVDEDARHDMQSIGDIPIGSGEQAVPLRNVAEIRSAAGPNTINRENVQRKIVVSANVTGSDLRGVVHEMQERIAREVKLPEGYHVEYGGQFESEQSASRVIGWASVLSVTLIFLLLFREFRRFSQSVAVLLNLPLALIGGVFAIALSGGTLSLPAIIGFISLFGIATRNGMLLVDRYNSLRHEGLSTAEAIRHGSLDRLNPILMTALCSAMALVPLAIAGDLPGNEIQSPMAKVILGGLLSSTLLNAFIIPIIYSYIEKDEKEEMGGGLPAGRMQP